MPILLSRERGGSVVECRTPEREVGGSKPTAAVLCPWARHFTPRKYWLITQEAVAPSRHDWKIVDWDVKPQHKQTKQILLSRSTTECWQDQHQNATKMDDLSWARAQQNKQMTCAPSEALDQPTQSDQSLLCALLVAKDPNESEDSN